MGSEYSPAIDMFVAPDRVFTNALSGINPNDLTIVIHKTICGGVCTATDVANFFAKVADKRSAHFIVGKDGSVIQCVHLKDGAGANCCPDSTHSSYWYTDIPRFPNLNLCTISIEHEDWSSDGNDTITVAQLASSYSLVSWLINKFHIPRINIQGHNSINATHCPGNYPIADLRAFIARDNMNLSIAQAAQDTWQSSPLGILPYDTGIANSWRDKYLSGVNMPAPTSHEFSTVDWNGSTIVAQMFSSIRCEWSNGNPMWLGTWQP